MAALSRRCCRRRRSAAAAGGCGTSISSASLSPTNSPLKEICLANSEIYHRQRNAPLLRWHSPEVCRLCAERRPLADVTGAFRLGADLQMQTFKMEMRVFVRKSLKKTALTLKTFKKKTSLSSISLLFASPHGKKSLVWAFCWSYFVSLLMFLWWSKNKDAVKVPRTSGVVLCPLWHHRGLFLRYHWHHS